MSEAEQAIAAALQAQKEAVAANGLPSIPPKIAGAIAAVMADVPKLARGEKNTHGSYNFASIDDFLEALRPLCAAHGLLIIQDEEQFSIRESEGVDKFGKPSKAAWLLLSYRFTLAHTSGETWGHRPIRSIMVNASMGSQAFGAAQSYTLKQFMRSLFQVATGEKGQDADEHPPADLPARKTHGPDWGKSSQAKKRGDWDDFMAALKACQSALEIDRLERKYEETVYGMWSQAWREKAMEEFEKYRADFKEPDEVPDWAMGKAPGEALTTREQLEGSIAALKDGAQSRSEYVQWCHDWIANAQAEPMIVEWVKAEAPARKRWRLSPAEDSDILSRARERIKEIREATFVPNARERAAMKEAGE